MMSNNDNGFFDYMMFKKTSGGGGDGGGGQGESGLGWFVVLCMVHFIIKLFSSA